MASAAQPPGTHPLKVDLSDLADAFDEASWELRIYLDLDTGAVIRVPPHIREELGAIHTELPDEPPGPEAHEPEWMREVRREADFIEAGLGSRFLQLPEANSRASHGDMLAFVATVPQPRLEERLRDALHGRSPFRRFKDVLLEYPEERGRWFTFKRRCLRDRARAWLAAERIAPIEEES